MKIKKEKKALLVLAVIIALLVSSNGAMVFAAEDVNESVYVDAKEEDQEVEFGNITGDYEDAIDIYAYDGHTATVTTGSLMAELDEAYYADGAYIDAEYGGTVDLTVNGDIQARDTGVDFVADEDATVDVTVNGNIEAGTGVDAWVYEGSKANVKAEGNITAKDEGGSGVYAWVEGSSFNAEVGGNITSEGEEGYGIYAKVENGDAEANITVAGDVNANGGSDTYGIYAYGNWNSNTNIEVGGNISADGDQSFGIYVNGGEDASLSVMNITAGGSISANGESGMAIDAEADNEAIINIEAGDINANGQYGKGIVTKATGASEIGVTINGDISAMGEGGAGIYANVSEGGVNNIMVNGDITAGSDGIEASAGSGIAIGARLDSEKATANITVNGNVTGIENEGIMAMSSGDNINVTVNGDANGNVGIGILQMVWAMESSFVEISDPETVDGYEAYEVIIDETTEEIYMMVDGEKVMLDVDVTTFAIRDQNGEVQNVGVYTSDEEFKYWILKDYDKSNEPADTVIIVDGDVTGETSGIRVLSYNLMGIMGRNPGGDEDQANTLMADVLITGTLSGGESAVLLMDDGTIDNNLTLTVWAVEVGEDGTIAKSESRDETKDKAEEFEKNIKYIIKVEQPEKGGMLSAVSEFGEPLEKSHDYDVALEGEKVLLKVDLEEGYKVVAAYNGDGEKVPLLQDAEGNYYVEVPKGGGVYLTAELDLEEYEIVLDFGTGPLDGETGPLNGETGPLVIKAKYGDTIILPEPKREGYKFLYWEGSKYYAGDAYVVREGHTLKAVWEKLETPMQEETEKPVAPTETEKTTPTKAATPTAVATSTVKSGAPLTGDETNIFNWMALMLLTVAGVAALIEKKARG